MADIEQGNTRILTLLATNLDNWQYMIRDQGWLAPRQPTLLLYPFEYLPFELYAL